MKCKHCNFETEFISNSWVKVATDGIFCVKNPAKADGYIYGKHEPAEPAEPVAAPPTEFINLPMTIPGSNSMSGMPPNINLVAAPAVEPHMTEVSKGIYTSKFCSCITPNGCLGTCLRCNRPLPKAGSTRPERDQSNIDNEKLLDDMIERLRPRSELCLAVMSGHQALPGDRNGNTLIRCQLLKGHEKDGSRCSNSPRPEMPPASEHVRLCALSEPACACRDCNKYRLHLARQAASVQQEPLSAAQSAPLTQADQKQFNSMGELWEAYLEQQSLIVDLRLAASGPLGREPELEAGEWNLKPCPFCGAPAAMKRADDDSNYIECTKCGGSTNLQYSIKEDGRPHLIERWNKRAAQPAAPRTQVRELARAEEAEKIASNGLDEIRRLTEEVVRLKEAQARTQPAPKCPKCGSAEIYLYTTECIVRCPNCREVYPTLHVKDFAQFFTALPEAQPTKKENA